MLRDYVEQRFTPELRTAFEAWQADGEAAAGPFAEQSYVPEGTATAAALAARADGRFTLALEMNQRADNYSILTVLFALVLFLTALSQRELRERLRDVLLTTAIGGALIGLALLATFPIKL
ncbi:hypothetical protein [Curtobacterium flaccumfaciens]|uniref:hypothetical protein n=1 Tax=Curtobacterium flaccumfaciens TaxID=2035 RepID=UPI001FE683A5|nr:hypothetical protein [Curtobacterium flaccumfaciens]